MTDASEQRTLEEFSAPSNAPDHPQCKATADHSGERCERVATIGDVVCSYHVDQLHEFTDGPGPVPDATPLSADGGTSIPRRTDNAMSDD